MKKLDLDRKEPLLINILPVGNNDLTSRATFYQRKLYEIVANETTLTGDNEAIDFWYKKLMYGRINTSSKAVHVSEAFLKQIPGTSNLFALNFVVDAFKDFTEYWDSLKTRGVLEEKSPLFNIRPASAWTDLNLIYHNYMITLYGAFKSFVPSFDKDKYIKDFDSFLNIFSQFVDQITPSFALTRSRFVVSRISDPRISGLMIEIANANHGSDLPKVIGFMADPNFEIYKDTAQRFGFKIDKHAPWRLTADLGSPGIEPYMKKYDIITESMFEKYYYSSHQVDLEALKVYVIQFYNSFVSGKPEIFEPQVELCNGRPVVRNKQTIRQQVTFEEINRDKTDQFWLRFYLFARGREQNKEWSQSDFEKHAKNSFHFQKGLDKATALEYIDRVTRAFNLSARRERGFGLFNNQRLI